MLNEKCEAVQIWLIFLTHNSILTEKNEMGVINNLYLISKSAVEKSNLENIETKLRALSLELYRKIVEEGKPDGWQAEEINSLSRVEFQKNSGFISDEDFYFYENESGKTEIGEFAENELRYYAICPICNFNLYNKIVKFITEKFEKQQDDAQLRFPFNANTEGLQCSNCSSIIEINKLTGRKIIGSFRVKLHHLIFQYFSINEITDFFNVNGKDDFYIEHYQYV